MARFVLTDGVGRLSAAAAAVAGGACRWSFCSDTVDRAVGTPAAQGGGVGLGEVARVLRKGWPAANGRRRWPLSGAHRRPTAACRGTVGCSPNSGRLLLFASKQGPCIYPAVRRPPSTCVRRDRRWTAGHAAAVRRALPRDGLAFPGDRREG
jgi:hypothetical protein